MSKHKKRQYKRKEKTVFKWERPYINKNAIKWTVLVAVIMGAIALYSWRTADEGFVWLWLSAAVIALTAVVNLFQFRYIRWLEILFTAFAPAALFMLVESYTHLLSAMWEGPVFLNIVIYYLFFGFLVFVTGRTGRAIIAEAILLGAAGLANYFVIFFRSSPILPWDLYSIGVAATVADNFEYDLSVRACNVLLLLILLCMLARRLRMKIKFSRFRVLGMGVFLVLMLGFGKVVQTDGAIAFFHMDTTLFTPTVFYRNNGLVLSFVVNMRYLDIEKPADYSEEKLAEIQEEFSGDAELSGNAGLSGDNKNSTDGGVFNSDTSPNIIVIMNEAFSDLSVLGDYETNVEVTPFIDSLTENTRKGWLYASVKGGNTANTEFEFLTGLSMYFLPVGSIPYQQYIRSELPALPGRLSSLGYTSVAIHPYYSSGWNRKTVYDDLGFDEKYFINDFDNPEKYRIYVSDWATYEKIISRYESKAEDERLFVFDVTMQNHGSYVKTYSNFVPDVSIIDGSGTYLAAAEQYLSLIKKSDEAFEKLVSYFENQTEPTVILMFGDHQPANYLTNVVDTGKTMGDWGNDQLYDEDSNDRKERYIVPYVLWANYDIEEDDTDNETSANYLALELLDAAGLPLTDFQSFLKELQQEAHVISDRAVKLETPASDEEAEKQETLLDSYYLLQYNMLFDGENRLEDFFE